MAVKHVRTGEVHRGTKEALPGCGFDTKAQPDHWVGTTERLTCAKNGCEN